MNRLLIGTVLGLVCGAAAISGTAQADPLGGKEPWNFTPVNRAGLAVAMQQVENPNNGGGSGAGTTIVCGGNSGAGGDGATGSASGATANNNCVIVNNSTGVIVETDQDSVGNQSSSANATQTTNNPHGSIDDVSAILQGNKQGL